MKNKTIPQMDNVEFISYVMSFGSPMKQMVVLDAVSKYVDQVCGNEDAVLKQMAGQMIYGPAWVAACKEIKKQLEDRVASANQVEAQG